MDIAFFNPINHRINRQNQHRCLEVNQNFEEKKKKSVFTRKQLSRACKGRGKNITEQIFVNLTNFLQLSCQDIWLQSIYSTLKELL